MKSIKKGCAVILSLAMSVQFGLADSYYLNALADEVSPEQEEVNAVSGNGDAQQTTSTDTEESSNEDLQQVDDTQMSEEESLQSDESTVSAPVSDQSEEVTKDYSSDIVFNQSTDVTYNVDETVATVTMRVDTTDAVSLDFTNATEAIVNNADVSIDNSKTTSDQKTWVLNITKNGTYTFNAIVVDNESGETVGSKDIIVSVTGIKEKKEEASGSKAKKESEVKTVDEMPATEETLDNFYVTTSKKVITIGDNSVEVKAHFEPSTITNKNVTWSSSNEEVATVDQNGQIKTVGVGNTIITATPEINPNMTATIGISVESVKVTKIEISGYSANYLTTGDTVSLTATASPDDAADKTIAWTSSNPKVATVDENGLVEAVGQGTVNIVATNPTTHVYATQAITVYEKTPATYRVNVWVTNQSQNTSYTFNVPKNGAEVSVSSIAVPVLSGSQGTLVSSHQYRVGSFKSESDWDTIKKQDVVQAFKYDDNVLKYTTDGSTWKSVGSNSIYDFCNIQYKEKSTEGTDVKVTMGDWPYNDGTTTKNSIQVIVKNSENKDSEVYNSGVMYFGPNHNKNLGNINFNCDVSKYEVYKVVITKNGSSYDTITDKTKIKDISVKFSTSDTKDKYVVTAYIQAKTLTLQYDGQAKDGLEVKGVPASSKIKTTDTNITVGSAPTMEGYIFTGWALNDGSTTTIYQPGDVIPTIPTSAINSGTLTLEAHWIKASEQITYTVNDSNGGSVSKTYERFNEGQTSTNGSVATAKSGYVFVNWTDADGKVVSTQNELKPEVKAAAYTANFVQLNVANVYNVTYNGSEQKQEPEVSVTVNGKKTVLKKDKDYTLSYESDDYTNVGTDKKVKVNFIGKYAGLSSVEKTYEINQKTLTVTTPGASKKYDGTPLTATAEGKITGFVKDEKADFTITGSQTDAGSSKNTYTLIFADQEGASASATAKSGNYTVSEKVGTLTVTGQTINPDDKDYDKEFGIVVNSPSDVTYNGLEQKWAPTITAKNGKVTLTSDDYDVAYDKTDFTNVTGTITVTITGKGNYSGTVTRTYQITKAPLTITTPSDEKIYDGTPLTKEGSYSGLVNGETIGFSTTGTIKDVLRKSSDEDRDRTVIGVENSYELTWAAEGNEYTAKASNYAITENLGTLKILPKQVTVTANNATKIYGKDDPTFKAKVRGTLEGDEDKIVYTIARKSEQNPESVGDHDIVPGSQKVQGNYEVSYVKGILTITPSDELNVTATSLSETYNGASHSASTATANITEGTTISYFTYDEETKNWVASEGVPSRTDVGTTKVKAEATNPNYKTATVEYTLDVTPASVTVKAKDTSKVYGESDPELSAEVSGLIGEDEVSYTVERETGEKVGTYAITASGEATQGNYKVEYAPATFTITSQSINPEDETYSGITMDDPSDFVYNGKIQAWKPVVKDSKGNVVAEDMKNGWSLTYSSDKAKDDDLCVDVQNITVTIVGNGNYTGEVTKTYRITPRPYTVTTESASKVYDGSALKAEAKLGNIVKGETYELHATGSQTDVGSSDNTYSLQWNLTAKEKNYTLSKESIGTLTVSAQSIDPSDDTYTGINVSDPSDVVYNGKIQAWKPVVTDKSGNAIVEDMRNGWSINYVDSDQINVGTITVQILGNGNYTGMLTKTYKITPATAVVTTESATKTYDGSALSASVSLSGIVEGETYELHATGSQTEVGSSTNTYSLAWNGTAKESNYTITEKLGTLTVSQATTPVTPSDNTTPTTPVTPVTPARRVTPNNNVTPVTPSQEETIDEDTTPKAKEKETEKVEKEKTPKAKAKAYWALINLLAAILTVLFGLVLLLSKRHKDDENEEDSEDAETNDENESEEAKKRGMISRVLAVLLGIGSVVFFLLTEDMSNLMTWTDKYTVWMVVLTVVQIVVFCVGRKWKDDSEEDEEENA